MENKIKLIKPELSMKKYKKFFSIYKFKIIFK